LDSLAKSIYRIYLEADKFSRLKIQFFEESKIILEDIYILYKNNSNTFQCATLLENQGKNLQQIVLKIYNLHNEVIDFENELKQFKKIIHEIYVKDVTNEKTEARKESENELNKFVNPIHRKHLNLCLSKITKDPELTEKLWNELADNMKNSNQQQADHIPVKLRAFGYETKHKSQIQELDPHIPPNGIIKQPVTEFTNQEIEIMARMEQERWCAERFIEGWIFSKVTDKDKKFSPYLVDWDELEPEVKEYNYEFVRNIPFILELVDELIYRK
jgi:hypothetical protein